MEIIKNTLDPLLQSMPDAVADYGVLIFLVAALAVLLPVAWYQRRLLQVLVVGRRGGGMRFPEPPEEDLSQCPMPSEAAGNRRIVVQGIPARARLVVLAPLGTAASLEGESMEEILNHLIWGLGTVVGQERPRVVIWPPQLSAHGFSAVFHRLTRKPEADGEPSRWLLIAGPTPPRPRPVLVGLALWTDESTTVGRISMQPTQWVSSIFIQSMLPSIEPDSQEAALGQAMAGRQVLDNRAHQSPFATDISGSPAPNVVPKSVEPT
jgi:hypothetical protein